MRALKYGITILSIGVLFSCSTDEIGSGKPSLDLPETSYNYALGNDDEATLGRVLFYDPQLSVNNSVSCESCHKQSLAFADNVAFSLGFDNRRTTRNSMPIQNLINGAFIDPFDPILPGSGFGFSSGLFWDGRGFNHSQSVLQPVVNHIEMGIRDLDDLAEKLSSIEYYPELFNSAYGTEEITPERIGFAINGFIANIFSNDTRLDNMLMHGDSSMLSASELLGLDLFFNKYDCNSCHQVQDPGGYIFAGTFANIGLESDYSDEGLSAVTSSELDNGKFKIPSLRNVTLTAPYMHDGRFETLEEVMGHYSTGIENHPNLDDRLKDEGGSPANFEISDQEVRAIISFLGTLTDYSMLTDERLSNPFTNE